MRVDDREGVGGFVAGQVVIGDDHVHAVRGGSRERLVGPHAVVDGHDHPDAARGQVVDHPGVEPVAVGVPIGDRPHGIGLDELEEPHEQRGATHPVDVVVPTNRDALAILDGLRKACSRALHVRQQGGGAQVPKLWLQEPLRLRFRADAPQPEQARDDVRHEERPGELRHVVRQRVGLDGAQRPVRIRDHRGPPGAASTDGGPILVAQQATALHRRSTPLRNDAPIRRFGHHLGPMSSATTPAQVRHVILGTAGHIDHGKTSLVEKLTGTWADKLPEERERGMTIDLGYAAFTLGDGTEAGLIDVPGHESFVHTMVAGASATDLALLVVAADDGPMPQTREHVDILDVLGVTRLVVALTKIDLVEEEMADIAEEEIRELLAPTAMADAPIVRVSSETGQGVEDVRAALTAALPPEGAAKKDDGLVFRMPVLRRFTVPGRGTVVTGIPLSGRIAEGAAVVVLPGDRKARVRGVQVHGHDANEAARGQRVALALSDVGPDVLKRGMVVTEAGGLEAAQRFAVHTRVLPRARKPLEHGDRVRFHVGAAKIIAQVHLPLRKPIAQGQSGIVELNAVTPVVAAPNDRFVLREENSSGTIGGGVVVERLDRPLPKRRQGIIDTLAARVEHLGKPSALFEACLAAAGERSISLDDIAARTAIRPERLPGFAANLKSKGIALPVGRNNRWISAQSLLDVEERLEGVFKRLHEKHAGMATLPLSAVRSAMGRTDALVFDEALARLIEKGDVEKVADGSVRHADHSDEIPERDKPICNKILGALNKGGGQPPSLDDLEADLDLKREDVSRAMRLLQSRHLVFKAEDHWFDGAWLEDAKRRLREMSEKNEGFTPAEARTALNTTRKWIIPLLEALDKSGFSRRVGDKRVVKE